MISVFWLIPAVLVGAFIGFVVVALLSANDDPKRPPKWWDNDGNV